MEKGKKCGWEGRVGIREKEKEERGGRILEGAPLVGTRNSSIAR